MIGIYSFLIRSNKEIIARQNAIQQWYELLEKLNILMQDYTVDYEEYFNRQMVWCVNSWGLLTWSNFKWNVWLSWYCTEFTAYGNENSTEKWRRWSRINSGYHDIYYCSSDREENQRLSHRVLKREYCWKWWKRQSFGQYAALFTDVKEPTNNEDDKNLWQPVMDWLNSVNAIANGDNIQELYLISHDWKSRLFFRRKLTNQTSGYAQYRIQMLRLRWFDAWQDHNFDSTNIEWLYDWQIDTWACDTSMWFIWSWESVWWAYSGYHLPNDVDDCRIDLTYWSTSIFAWNLNISPINDPILYWSQQERQINPYMKILVVAWVYFPEIFSKSLVGSSIAEFKVPIQTTINMKDFYRE